MNKGIVRRIVSASLTAVFCALLCSAAAAADKMADWKAMDRLLADFYANFNYAAKIESDPSGFVGNWEKWKERYADVFGGFETAYGATREQIEKNFSDNDRPEGVANGVWTLFSALSEINVAAHEKQMAAWAAQSSSRKMQKWTAFKPASPEKTELKLKYAQRAARFAAIAKQLDPDGAYEELSAKAAAAIKKSEAAFDKVLKTIKWPGHNPEFKGNAKALSRAALEFLRKNKWSKPEYDDAHRPVAACVTGKDWEVSKTTVLGQPTQYSINMAVAFEGDHSGKTLYAYHMVFYTKEEAGVKKALPFHYGNSRQYACFKILRSAVPVRGGCCPGAAGAAGLMLRIVLGLLCVTLGLLALESVLKKSFPGLGALYAVLSPLSGVLAPASVLAALAFFALSLLASLNPFASVLPQGLLALTGLMLRAERGAKKAADMQSFSGVLRINREALGWACAFFGLTHILFGSLWFL